MKTKRALVALLLPCLAFPRFLQARVNTETPPLGKISDKPLPPHPPDDSVIREVAIDMDLRIARDPAATKVRLPLFGGGSFLDLVETSRSMRKGSVIWSGRVDRQPASNVTFSVGKEALIANIATQPTAEKSADYYEIQYLGGGRHVLRQYDPSKLPSDGEPPSPEPRIASATGPPPPPPLTCSTDPATTIDALIVYTPAASAMIGGADAMEQAINVYVENTNVSYQNSGIAQRLRLVQTQQVNYVESGNPKVDRDRLKRRGDALDEVHALRDEFGADVVALIVEYTLTQTRNTSCGEAFLMENVSNAFESSAFTAVPRICADRSNGLPHELGHLMGARHDWFVDEGENSPNKPFPFSHGFVHRPTASDPGPAFRTLMAKVDECADQHKACDQVLFWSNPNVTYPGSSSPMGVSTGERPSNNAQTLNQTAPVVANFRCHKN